MRGRRLFIDWARGLAVLCMIEHHTFDAFLPAAFHGSPLDRLFRFVGGIAAPSFLFLAGVSMALMMERRLEKGATRGEAARAAAWRALLILAGAYAFRLQEWALARGASPAWTILRIDVLNCIGVALMLVALLWWASRMRLAAIVAFAMVALGISLISPAIWHADFSSLPQHFADYLNGRSPRALFPLFPWIGFAFAGGAVGLLSTRFEERKLFAALSVAAVALWFGAKLVDPRPDAPDWWTVSPVYFWQRCCSEVWLLAACLLVQQIVKTGGPLLKLGQHSLIVYWVHVELVYGSLTWRMRGTLELPRAALVLAIVVAMMVALSYLVEPAKKRVADLRAAVAG